MKITFSFGDTKVVVPCGSGSFTIRDLAERAVTRFKNISSKVSHKDKIILYNLKTADDGGILDWDDSVQDVLDDKDMVIASYKLGKENSETPSGSDQDSENSPSENYINPLKIQLINSEQKKDIEQTSTTEQNDEQNDSPLKKAMKNLECSLDLNIPVASEEIIKPNIENLKSQNFSALQEVLQRRRELVRHFVDEYEYEEDRESSEKSQEQDTNQPPRHYLKESSPKATESLINKIDCFRTIEGKDDADDLTSTSDDDGEETFEEDNANEGDDDYEDDREDINSEGLQTVRRAMIQKLENDKNRGLILPPPPKDLTEDIETRSVESDEKQSLNTTEVENDDDADFIPHPSVTRRSHSHPRLFGNRTPERLSCDLSQSHEKSPNHSNLLSVPVEKNHEVEDVVPEFGLVVAGYESDDAPPLVAVPSTIVEEDEDDYNTTEDNEDDSRITTLQMAGSNLGSGDKTVDQTIDEDYPMLRKDYIIKQQPNEEVKPASLRIDRQPRYSLDSRREIHYNTMPGVNPNILKWLETSQLNENSEVPPDSMNSPGGSSNNVKDDSGESWDDRLSSVTSKYNNTDDNNKDYASSNEDLRLVKINNTDNRGENLGMQIKPILSGKDKSNSSTSSSNRGIEVHSITPNGRMDREKLLNVGDRIIFINNQNLTSLPFDKCRALFQESLKHDIIQMHIIPIEKSSTLKMKGKCKSPPKDESINETSEDTLIDAKKTVENPLNDGLLKSVPPPPPRRSPNTSLTNNKTSSRPDNCDEDVITQLEGSFPPPSFSPPPLPTPDPLRGNAKVPSEKSSNSRNETNVEVKKKFEVKIKEMTPPKQLTDLSIIQISLRKGVNGLGFSLTTRETKVDGRQYTGPVYVKNILPGGSAISNGLLRQGDRLLKVDGVDVSQIGQTKIVGMLRDKPINSSVNITIARSNSITSTSTAGQSSNSSLAASSNHNDDSSRKTSVTSFPQDIHSKLLARLSNFSENSHLVEYEISLRPNAQLLSGQKPATLQQQAQTPITLGISITIRCTQPNLEPDSPEAIKANAVYVRKLIDGGAAHRDGRLRIGDRLLAIDNQPLSGLSANEALHILKSEIARDLLEEKPSCRLVISRNDVSQSQTQAKPSSNSDSDLTRRYDKKPSPKSDQGRRNLPPGPESRPLTSKDSNKTKESRDTDEIADPCDNNRKPQLPMRNHGKEEKNPEKYFTQKPSAFSLANVTVKKAQLLPQIEETVKDTIKIQSKNDEIEKNLSLDKNENIIVPDGNMNKSLNDDIDVSKIIPKCIMAKNLSEESNPDIMKLSINGILNKSFDQDLLTGWEEYTPECHATETTEASTIVTTTKSKVHTIKTSLYDQSPVRPKEKPTSEKSEQIYRCDSQGTVYSSDMSVLDHDEIIRGTSSSIDGRDDCTKKSLEYRSKSAIDCPYENRRELFINGLPLDQMVAIPLNSSYWKKKEADNNNPQVVNETNKNTDAENMFDKEEKIKEPSNHPVNSPSISSCKFSSGLINEQLINPKHASITKPPQQPPDSLSIVSDVSKKSVILSKMIKFVRPQYPFRKRSSSQSNERASKGRENRSLVGWSSVSGKTGLFRRNNSVNNVCNISVSSVPVISSTEQKQHPALPERRREVRVRTNHLSQSSDHIRTIQSNRVSMLLGCCEENSSPDVIHRKELSQERPKSQNSALPNRKSFDTITYSQDSVTIEKLYEKLREMKDPELMVNASNSALVRSHVPSVQTYRHHDFLQKNESLSPKPRPVPSFNPAPCCKKTLEQETEKHSIPSALPLINQTPGLTVNSLLTQQKRVNFSDTSGSKNIAQLASPESSLSYRSSSVSSESTYPTYERRPVSGYLHTRELQGHIPESNYSELTFDSRTMSRASNTSTLTKSSSKRPLRVPPDLQNYIGSPQGTVRIHSPPPVSHQVYQGQKFFIVDNKQMPEKSEKTKKPESKPILEDAEHLYTKIKNKFINKPQPTIKIPQYSPQFNNAFPPNMNLINNRIVKNIYLGPQGPQQLPTSLEQNIYHNLTIPRNQGQIRTFTSVSTQPTSRISSPNQQIHHLRPAALANKNEPIYAKVNKIYVLPAATLEN